MSSRDGPRFSSGWPAQGSPGWLRGRAACWPLWWRSLVVGFFWSGMIPAGSCRSRRARRQALGWVSCCSPIRCGWPWSCWPCACSSVEALDPQWLGATIITCALAWSAVHLAKAIVRAESSNWAKPGLDNAQEACRVAFGHHEPGPNAGAEAGRLCRTRSPRAERRVERLRAGRVGRGRVGAGLAGWFPNGWTTASTSCSASWSGAACALYLVWVRYGGVLTPRTPPDA